MRPIVPFAQAVAYRAHTGAGIGRMVGICAEIRVPPPIGLLDRDRAVERREAVGEAAQAAALTRVGTADAVVIDLDAQVIIESLDPHNRLGRLRVLRDVGQRLGDDEVRGALDGGE